MDAVGVACRVWYAVLPLVDTVFLSVEEITAQEIADAAQPGSVVDFPQVSTVVLRAHVECKHLSSRTTYVPRFGTESTENIPRNDSLAVVQVFDRVGIDNLLCYDPPSIFSPEHDVARVRQQHQPCGLVLHNSDRAQRRSTDL